MTWLGAFGTSNVTNCAQAPAILLAPALGTLGLGALGILGLGTLGTLGPLGLGALSTLRGTFFCSVPLRLLKLAFVPFQPSLPLRVFLLPFA